MAVARKQGVQVVGIDDGPHERTARRAAIVFAFCQGTDQRLGHVRTGEIAVDGLDATGTIIDTLQPVTGWFKMVFTHGITAAGLNMIDIVALHEALDGVPVVAVTENEPVPGALEGAISHLPGADARMAILNRAGPLHRVESMEGRTDVFFYCKGIEPAEAAWHVKSLSVRSRLPECLLLAHKIATGMPRPPC